MKKRFHTVEKLTDYGARQVLFKRGNKILAWAEEQPNLSWEYALGKKTFKTWLISQVAKSYQQAETHIIQQLEDRGEIVKICNK